MTSPLKTMARLTSPISPTMTGPKCRLPRIWAPTPNSRSNWPEARDNRIAHRHETAQRPAVDRAVAFSPGHDHLVADIIQHLAAIIDHRNGEQTKGAVEQAVDADPAEPFGQPGRARDVDEQHEAVFLHRRMIAAGYEVQERAAPIRLVMAKPG